MKVVIVRVGEIESSVLEKVQESIHIVFPDLNFAIAHDGLPVPKGSFDSKRRQCLSTVILEQLRDLADRSQAERVLGVATVDLYVPGLSFVFGEAESPGKAALVSLFRLRSEFYGRAANEQVLVERAEKEAVHELGHTFGLGHCENPFCVMHFSNSIFDTDRKRTLFCSRCYDVVESALDCEREKPF